MAISFDPQNKLFKLDSKGSTYVIQIGAGGFLLHQYYGATVSDAVVKMDLLPWHSSFYPGAADVPGGFSPDLCPMEYGTGGCGDMRICALSIRNSDGNTATDVRYQSHRIYAGKEKIPGMPSLRLEEDGDADTLEINALDATTGACVTLYYTVFRDYSVITRRVRVTNTDPEQSIWLRDVKSGCIDLPTSDYDLLHLWGCWGKERTYERQRLMHGIQTIASNRGVSGHSHNPFAALAQREATEESGEVYGFNLVYSGNFSVHCEVNAMDETRLVMGINEWNFEWELAPGAVFDAPELVMVYSDTGIGGMSRTFHRLYHRHLVSKRWRDTPRPLLINSWEAAYFDFDDEKLLDFARRAKELGIEMLVMDDGWFGRRNSDKCSLGDWYVNEEKLHGGLGHLIDRVHAMGLKFGIWYEPEMISPDSDLYRAHPDWCIHVPGREISTSRNQYVLDMSRADVRDNIWAQMYQVLSENPVDYIKWDFNRNLTEVGSALLDADHQLELYHRFILGTYDLMNRLVTAFPDVLLENCSGGGGRFDPAMLSYSPQIWTSDNTDPIERLTIQFGTSLCYPASTMGAHVSASKRTEVETKGLIARWGSHGYELDPNRYTPEEREIVKGQVADYHRFYRLTHEGDLYRLVLPTENPYYCAWEQVAQDRHEALITVINMRKQPTQGRFLKCRGLDPAKNYICETTVAEYNGVVRRGDTWMHAGFNLCAAPMGDGTGYSFYLKQTEG